MSQIHYKFDLIYDFMITEPLRIQIRGPLLIYTQHNIKTDGGCVPMHDMSDASAHMCTARHSKVNALYVPQTIFGASPSRPLAWGWPPVGRQAWMLALIQDAHAIKYTNAHTTHNNQAIWAHVLMSDQYIFHGVPHH